MNKLILSVKLGITLSGVVFSITFFSGLIYGLLNGITIDRDLIALITIFSLKGGLAGFVIMIPVGFLYGPKRK
jgi:hypothetical protein